VLGVVQPDAKMTEQRSTVEDSTVPMTAQVEVTSVTTGNDMTSSTGVYYQCAVIFIGVVGTAANSLILYALVVSKQHEKHVLVFNQNALDLFSCLFLVITYIVSRCNIYLFGLLGHWLCLILLCENLLWIGIHGSTINLAAVTVERYLKVVHAVWSKNKLRNWIIYSAAAFSWISSIVYNLAVNFTTSAVIDGVCYGPYGSVKWESRVAEMAHGIWNFVSFYLLMILLFIFCYWRILVTIRGQASVMAGHTGPGPSAAQTQSNKIKSNIIKTMILVSGFFALTWMPANVYYFILNLNSNLTLLEDAYYAFMFISFLYICANPFIYAAKFHPVKRVLLSLIPCKRTTQEAAG